MDDHLGYEKSERSDNDDYRNGYKHKQVNSRYSSSPVGYLEGIFVLDEYKKRGYAKELLGECQNWAKDQGCLEFASDCELNNEDSLKFHLKMGFAEVIIPAPFEPPVRSLRATLPAHQSHTFR